MISPKYADDLSFIGTSNQEINAIEDQIPNHHASYNLQINQSKTERYIIPAPLPPPPPPPTEEEHLNFKEEAICWSDLDWIVKYKQPKPKREEPWKECKLLGSKLDTTKDIERRKGLTIDSVKVYKKIFNSKLISIKTKVRTFNAFRASIFLHNSEIWAVNDNISTDELYRRTEVEKWSLCINRRRLNWLGHLIRMNIETLERKALLENIIPIKRKIGRPPNTWLKVIQKDLKSTDISLDINKDTTEATIKKLEYITRDRVRWKQIIKDIIAEYR